MQRVEDGVEHVAQYGGLQAGRVGVDQHEEGMVGEQEGCSLQEGINAFLDLPDFALWSSAVGGGIHDDGVVMVSPADLTLYKFAAVIHQPSDGSFPEAGQLGIFFCPGDHSF